MGQSDKTSSMRAFPWKEILAFLGVLFAAYIGYLGIRSQIEIPIQATQTSEARQTEVAGVFNMTQSAMAPPETPAPTQIPTTITSPTYTPTPPSPTYVVPITSTYTSTSLPPTSTPTPTSLPPTSTPTPTSSPPTVDKYELNYASWYEILAGGPNRGGGSANMACPSGYIITGLLGKKGDYITGIGLYCSLLRNDGMTGERISTKVYGNNGGVTWDGLMCPPNKAFTGINGVYGGYVDRIQGICSYIANIDNPEPSETGWAGEGGANINTSSCDPGYFVTGIKIRWGDYIDGLTMICTQVVRR